MAVTEQQFGGQAVIGSKLPPPSQTTARQPTMHAAVGTPGDSRCAPRCGATCPSSHGASSRRAAGRVRLGGSGGGAGVSHSASAVTAVHLLGVRRPVAAGPVSPAWNGTAAPARNCAAASAPHSSSPLPLQAGTNNNKLHSRARRSPPSHTCCGCRSRGSAVGNDGEWDGSGQAGVGPSVCELR